jgi:hypothetical protein
VRFRAPLIIAPGAQKIFKKKEIQQQRFVIETMANNRKWIQIFARDKLNGLVQNSKNLVMF